MRYPCLAASAWHQCRSRIQRVPAHTWSRYSTFKTERDTRAHTGTQCTSRTRAHPAHRTPGNLPKGGRYSSFINAIVVFTHPAATASSVSPPHTRYIVSGSRSGVPHWAHSCGTHSHTAAHSPRRSPLLYCKFCTCDPRLSHSNVLVRARRWRAATEKCETRGRYA